MKKRDAILRTHFADRICHWFMVICFLLVALSGLSWFFPTMNWLNGVLGTPQMARILHPILGIVVFLALMFLFVRLVKYNLPEREDLIWIANIKSVLQGKHMKGLQIGKYNAGQKLLFWGIMSLISLLLISGLVVWRAYFAEYFPIPVIRIGLLLHSFAGICLILLIMGHAYMGFWVKGSIDSMITGYVSKLWAKTHHDRWYKKVTTKQTKTTGEK
ncbi:formate dehydrogenase [Pseudomonas sp. RIT-PI-q]|uniref:formate dehydrogenase subunit gamma n=1 Tax=Pseudomonas sp. RIT-PI-q TaxID=1690247 RepID=UPI0006CD9039|nr:formate dehydrogenase subunit gamma [Pseudomonas sp. RIT-PI-q]KPG95945.1 formate dehydrogenase [Pseudomonas sp. RIT-PI-q]